jgi:hypothetical protein
MSTTLESRRFVSDERVLHALLAFIGLARVAVALVRSEAWGTGPTLGLLLALWAGWGLFRRAER